jgi:hypothetical protein
MFDVCLTLCLTFRSLHYCIAVALAIVVPPLKDRAMIHGSVGMLSGLQPQKDLAETHRKSFTLQTLYIVSRTLSAVAVASCSHRVSK